MGERRTETNLFASADPGYVESVEAAEDKRESLGALVEKFGVPPFSVIDCRQEYWQKINRAYISKLGIRSELGRDSDVLEHSGSYAFTTASADRIRKFHERADVKPNVQNICSQKWDRGQKPNPVLGGGGNTSLRKAEDLHQYRTEERGGRCFGEDIMRGEGATAEKLGKRSAADMDGAVVGD